MNREEAIKYIQDLLKQMMQRGASDMFLTAGAPPMMRINGEVQPISNQVLNGAQTQMLARSIMNEKQTNAFEKYMQANLEISVQNIARFRIQISQQRNHVAIVVREVNSQIPSLEDLGLPSILKQLAMTKRGLIFFIGPAGSGRSTSLASMLDYRNANSHNHIVTVEDPIEFLYTHKKSIVNQYEVRVDVESYEMALRNTLNQAPDVVFIGEIMDKETLRYAITFAEKGYLCLSSFYAVDAQQTLERIISFFPEEGRQKLLMDLALNVKALVSQRLVPTQEEGKRVPILEILINTPEIAELIIKGKLSQLKEKMAESTEVGMQTFDQVLFKLYEENVISYEEVLHNCDSISDLQAKIRGESTRGAPEDGSTTLDSISTNAVQEAKKLTNLTLLDHH